MLLWSRSADVTCAMASVQSGEQVTQLSELQDIDELHVVEVTHAAPTSLHLNNEPSSQCTCHVASALAEQACELDLLNRYEG